MKRLLLLINPVAGRGRFHSALGKICAEFAKGGFAQELRFSACPGDMERLARELAADFDLLVCVGGDGTLSEVISGLMALPVRPPLGYIPLGTTNDVAKTLHLPRNPRKAAQRIVEGTPRSLDVGAYGELGYFTYVTAFGAFTALSYETPQAAKRSLGHLAYLLGAVGHLRQIRPHSTRVEVDGAAVEADLLVGAVTNSLSVAGVLKLDEKLVDLADGRFEVLLVKHPKSPAELLRICAELLSR
ncbi:MAG: YegS/Rv2252/BmrU family lipid kinase, partial [Firmicutes bacterium]|nr:YegS/Rv2252/BmrU family lipid kinase [Bacillota bacterium]